MSAILNVVSPFSLYSPPEVMPNDRNLFSQITERNIAK